MWRNFRGTFPKNLYVLHGETSPHPIAALFYTLYTVNPTTP
jgi:hypothetical protein